MIFPNILSSVSKSRVLLQKAFDVTTPGGLSNSVVVQGGSDALEILTATAGSTTILVDSLSHLFTNVAGSRVPNEVFEGCATASDEVGGFLAMCAGDDDLAGCEFMLASACLQ